MALITNLPEKTGILLGDQILVSLPAAKANTHYEVDGVKPTLKYSYGYPQQIIIQKDSVIEIVENDKKVITRYQKDDEILSLEEYNHISFENYGKYYDDDEDELAYPDLDTEFQCRKELEKLKEFNPVYDIIVGERKVFEYAIVGSAEKTGSKFIHNPLAFGKGTFTNANFYKVDLYGITCDELVDYCKKNNLTYKNEHKDTVKFACIDHANGKYVIYDLPKGLYADDCRYTTTLEEAKQTEEDQRVLIRKILDAKLKIVKTIDATSANEILGIINYALSYLSTVRPMKSSEASFDSGLKKVNEAKEKILTYIHEA